MSGVARFQVQATPGSAGTGPHRGTAISGYQGVGTVRLMQGHAGAAPAMSTGGKAGSCAKATGITTITTGVTDLATSARMFPLLPKVSRENGHASLRRAVALARSLVRGARLTPVGFTIFYFFSHLLDTSFRHDNYVLFEPVNPWT